MTKRARTTTGMDDLSGLERDCIVRHVQDGDLLNVGQINRQWRLSVREHFFNDAHFSELDRTEIRMIWFKLNNRCYDRKSWTEDDLRHMAHCGYLRCLQLVHAWNPEDGDDSIGPLGAVYAYDEAIMSGHLHIVQWLERVFASYFDVCLAKEHEYGEFYLRACAFGRLEIARRFAPRVSSMRIRSRTMRARVCDNILPLCIIRSRCSVAVEYLLVEFRVGVDDLLKLRDGYHYWEHRNLFDMTVVQGAEEVLWLFKRKFPVLTISHVRREALMDLLIDDDNRGALQVVFQVFGACPSETADYLRTRVMNYTAEDGNDFENDDDVLLHRQRMLECLKTIL
jgi:hypothetical protein